MRTAREWLRQAGFAVAAGVILISPTVLAAQETDREPGAAEQRQDPPEPADQQQEREPDAIRQQDRESSTPRTFRQREDEQGQRGQRPRDQADEGRAWLGVLLAPDEQGVRIVQVFPGSPADRAGIRVGDLLVGTNGQEFDTPEDVREAIGEEQPNSTATFTIERQGREQEIEVRLGSRPQMQPPGGRGFPGGPDMDRMMREFRGFGPDRQLVEEHRQIQQEHQRLKEQIGELQRELRELRRELDQLKQREGRPRENANENP